MSSLDLSVTLQSGSMHEKREAYEVSSLSVKSLDHLQPLTPITTLYNNGGADTCKVTKVESDYIICSNLAVVVFLSSGALSWLCLLIMATDEILRLCEALSLSEEDGPVLDIAEDNPVGPGAISQLRFKFSEFWIHIYNIPLACMNCKVARLIAEEVGTIVEFPMDSKYLWGKFFRIKVRIDILKPLKRGIRMRLENFDTLITALIKYERLPDFCYGCGFIGHSVRECHNSEVRKSIMEGVEPKFGVWLRAPPLDRSKPRHRGEDTSEAKLKAHVDIEDVDGACAEGARKTFIAVPTSSDKREGKSSRDIVVSPTALSSAARQKGGISIQDN
ncbi:hypothetical protein ACOSQ3_031127 [Xanthoceras sorbifolium]